MNYFLKAITYSNVYIAFIAWMMTWETVHRSGISDARLLMFVAAATLLTYYFHSLVNTVYEASSDRHAWNNSNKGFIILMLIVSGSLTFFAWWPFRYHIWPFALAALATFLYSAPNIPMAPFRALQKIAIGKTVYLALVWTYATTLLPLLLASSALTTSVLYFTLHRFFLVYAICIHFDVKDLQEDREKGVRTVATTIPERIWRIAYFISISASLVFALLASPAEPLNVLWAAPAILLFLQPRSGHRYDDMHYFIFFDGLMMMSSLLLALQVNLF